ncbi:MAG TPA: beta-propeller domain-containing protein [Methanoregulaceae archaeon]|nr:beta-propeller domain-containing protein [Methanoregulaceae archaeon]
MSPKYTPLILCALVILIAVIAAGCTSTLSPVPSVPSELKKFNSTAEIEQYLKDSLAAGQHDGYYPPSLTTGGMGTGVNVPQRSEEKSDSNIPAPSLPGGADYSQTNVQVAGVDEPDIIKNDNRYIYTISGSTLAIIDAYPAEDASVVSTTEINDTPRDLFVSGNRLILFSTGSERPETSDPYLKAVPPYYRPPSPVTHTTLYDISDRNHPKVLKEYTIEGDYIDARMIGSLVYLVTWEQIYTYGGNPVVVPVLREGTRTVIQPDVWYFDHPESQYTFTTITSLDASSGKEKDAQTYLLGTGNTLYVSEDAIYVSYPRYHPVIYKRMPQEVSPGLAVDAGGSAGVSSSKVSTIPSDFNTLPDSERQSILDSLRNAEQDAVSRQEADQTTTVIHKIGIRDGAILYLAKGEVPGTLDNQFSMDEYKNNLRVATTSSIYTPRFGQYTYNNVYVLDDKMATIGELTHIAEQETIYSTRFIGDRLYMVTFKRIDPFFVIDLAKPESPKILGKLKIPGYSDYLHPYDATHIIGIGRETTTNDWGGVSTSGVKLALFDVSDVTNPKQIDKVQIGDAGSDSAALTDHHAFLFDKGKKLLVIPIRAVSNEPVTQEDSYSAYRPYVWYGAYVFGLTPESGFTLRGTFQHGSGDSGYYYYGSSNSEVKRSLYIGDILYTMSAKQIKANPLGDLNTTVATIPLPNFGDILYPSS